MRADVTGCVGVAVALPTVVAVEVSGVGVDVLALGFGGTGSAVANGVFNEAIGSVRGIVN